MSLRGAYTLWAPLYDPLVAAPTRPMRQANLGAAQPGERVLLAGVGTGLDLEGLPEGVEAIGLDRTPAMLARAERRARRLDRQASLHLGDAQALPYGEAAFDRLFLHLILAVVPVPEWALAEAARVVRPGGRVHVLDKFLRPEQKAPIRRALSPLLGRMVTRTDVVFEEILAKVPQLVRESDEPAGVGDWYRRITLRRTGRAGPLLSTRSVFPLTLHRMFWKTFPSAEGSIHPR